MRINKLDKRWHCESCGFHIDTSYDEVKGTCLDCGKKLSDPNGMLCDACKKQRLEAAKEKGLKAAALGLALFCTVYEFCKSIRTEGANSESTMKIPQGVAGDNKSNDSDSSDDDEVYGLGPGLFPKCNMCGSAMTGFDGWAWYTCPTCGNRVRIIEDKVAWYADLFGGGKKKHRSDYELADFCRGGDLSED